jgi:hypothetical protein
MQWMKERDLLIAQTSAFVQSVTGKIAAADARNERREVLIEPTAADEIAKVDRPVETRPIETARTIRPSLVRVGDFREEIRGRVAAFRAHQALFNRERNEYFNSVLTRLRASTDQASKAPDDQSPKPPGMA